MLVYPGGGARPPLAHARSLGSGGSTGTLYEALHTQYSMIAVVILTALFLTVTITATGLLLAFCKKTNSVFSLQQQQKEQDSHFEMDDLDNKSESSYPGRMDDDADDDDDDDDDEEEEEISRKERKKRQKQQKQQQQQYQQQRQQQHRSRTFPDLNDASRQLVATQQNGGPCSPLLKGSNPKKQNEGSVKRTVTVAAIHHSEQQQQPMGNSVVTILVEDVDSIAQHQQSSVRGLDSTHQTTLCDPITQVPLCDSDRQSPNCESPHQTPPDSSESLGDSHDWNNIACGSQAAATAQHEDCCPDSIPSRFGSAHMQIDSTQTRLDSVQNQINSSKRSVESPTQKRPVSPSSRSNSSVKSIDPSNKCESSANRFDPSNKLDSSANRLDSSRLQFGSASIYVQIDTKSPYSPVGVHSRSLCDDLDSHNDFDSTGNLSDSSFGHLYLKLKEEDDDGDDEADDEDKDDDDNDDLDDAQTRALLKC